MVDIHFCLTLVRLCWAAISFDTVHISWYADLSPLASQRCCFCVRSVTGMLTAFRMCLLLRWQTQHKSDIGLPMMTCRISCLQRLRKDDSWTTLCPGGDAAKAVLDKHGVSTCVLVKDKHYSNNTLDNHAAPYKINRYQKRDMLKNLNIRHMIC